jgi:hypothetical protein
LGLISLQERTRALGGEMEIESVPGKGSKITLSIPLTLPESQDSAIFVPEAEQCPEFLMTKQQFPDRKPSGYSLPMITK